MSEWIAIIMALTVPMSVVGVLIERIANRKGIGVRVIQFVAVATMMPAIFILATKGFLDGSSVSALIGALVGYLFSHISEFDHPRRKGHKKNKKTA